MNRKQRKRRARRVARGARVRDLVDEWKVQTYADVDTADKAEQATRSPYRYTWGNPLDVIERVECGPDGLTVHLKPVPLVSEYQEEARNDAWIATLPEYERKFMVG